MNPLFPRIPRLHAALFSLLTWASLPAPTHAQTIDPKAQARAEQQQRSAAKLAALAAFKAGDTATGIAQITTLAQTRGKGTAEDLEVGRQLGDIGLQLHNERHAQAPNVVQLALAKLGAPEGRMSAKDAAAAYTAAGGLQEYVRGDLDQAKRAYERAVALDPSAKTARQRLEHLNAIDEIARAKAAANDRLAQQRSAKGKS